MKGEVFGGSPRQRFHDIARFPAIPPDNRPRAHDFTTKSYDFRANLNDRPTNLYDFQSGIAEGRKHRQEAGHTGLVSMSI